MTVHISGQLVTEIMVGSAGNKRVVEGFVGTASGNRRFFAALTSVSVSPTIVVGANLAASVISTAANASHQPPGSPVSFAWRRISGSSAITPSFPTAASTTFRALISTSQTLIARFVCDVTAGGISLTTDPVEVRLTRLSGGGINP